MNSQCKRCGTCCLMAPCHLGHRSDDAFRVCVHLSFSMDGIASCELLATGINPFENGCKFQNDPAYPTFVSMYAKLKAYLISRQTIQPILVREKKTTKRKKDDY